MNMLPNPTPLRTLYRDWRAAKEAFCALDDDNGDAKDAACSRLIAIEEEVAKFAPQTLEDMAFKIIFADDDGDLGMNACQIALAAHAYAIAGVEPRMMKGQ